MDKLREERDNKIKKVRYEVVMVVKLLIAAAVTTNLLPYLRSIAQESLYTVVIDEDLPC